MTEKKNKTNIPDNNDNWDRYETYVITSIKTLTEKVDDVYNQINSYKIEQIERENILKEKIDKELDPIKQSVEVLKYKYGVIYGIFALLGGGIISIIVYMIRSVI